MLIDSISKMSGNTSRSLPSFVPTASRIAERIGNRYKANGGAEYGDEEWANGSGLEMYETFYRSYNAQNLSREAKRIGIGRFMQGDPKMEVSMESYVFGKNNPASFTDYFGDLETAEYKTLEEIVVKKYSFSNTAQNVSDWVDLLLASSGFGGSGDWSFLGENNGGGGGNGKSKLKSNIIDTIPKKNYAGLGMQFSIGLGLGKHGTSLTIGGFGTPGSVGQLYFTVSEPDQVSDDFMFDLSGSTQVLFGISRTGNFDLSGKGENIGYGWDPFSFSYSADRMRDPNYQIFGIGPSVGAKYSGSVTKSKTYTIPTYIPMVFGGLS